MLLICLGVFYTFIDPQYQKTKTLRAEAGDYSNVLKNVDGIAESRDVLLEKYQKIPKNDISRLEKILPDNIDTVRLAMDFDSIASKYGISIKDIRVTSARDNNATTVAQPVSGGLYEKVSVSFQFTSTYENFRKFVSDIEESLRITDIRSTSFNSTENGLYNYSVTIDTYWLK